MITKLSEQMEKSKLTCNDVAYRLGVSKLIVQRWVAGLDTPRLLHALKLINLFPKLKPADLLKPQDLTKL